MIFENNIPQIKKSLVELKSKREVQKNMEPQLIRTALSETV